MFTAVADNPISHGCVDPVRGPELQPLEIEISDTKRAGVLVMTWMVTFGIVGLSEAQQILVSADRAQMAITRAQEILDIDDLDVKFASARLLGMVHI